MVGVVGFEGFTLRGLVMHLRGVALGHPHCIGANWEVGGGGGADLFTLAREWAYVPVSRRWGWIGGSAYCCISGVTCAVRRIGHRGRMMG